MAIVKFWVDNSEKAKMAVATGRKKTITPSYEETTLHNIINNWQSKERFKQVRITCGRSQLIEFLFYKSYPFLTYRKKFKPQILPFEGMFAINMQRIKLGESATEVVNLVDSLNCKKMSEFLYDTKDLWLTEESTIQILERLYEIMHYLPEYEVADILLSYD